MENPLVSVITPTHNRAHLLREAVCSIIEQSYQNFEVIIVDNGSEDNTRQVVNDLGDSRIRYFYQENSGSPVAPRNKGFSVARGDIICFLDSDDLWMVDKLAVQVSALSSSRWIGMVYTDCTVVDYQGRGAHRYSDYYAPRSGWVLEELLTCNFIPAVSVAIRKEWVDRCGPQNEKFLVAHDYDLFLKVAAVTQIGYIPEPLAKLRMHHQGFSRSRIRNKLEAREVVHTWTRGSLKDRLGARARRRIAAHWDFLTAVEMLDDPEWYPKGVAFLRDALLAEPWRWRFWLGYLLALAPERVIQRVLSVARRRWSAEGCYIHGH